VQESRTRAMKLQVTHRTEYHYPEPVSDSFNEARLQPTSSDGQICESFLLKVLPSTRLSHFFDFYMNYVHFFEVPEPHNNLIIESISTVTTARKLILFNADSTPLSSMVECLSLEKCYDFLQPSHYVELSPLVWRLAIDAVADEKDAWRAAVAIMRFIHSNFTYTPNTTGVNTHMREVIEKRLGVCQDFAHVMVGMCRSLRIPARYVSGYLYSGPREHLQGTLASHAWCEVFVPGLNWVGLDPTNNLQADDHYVKVAVGRDYADVSPVKGHYKGTTQKQMFVTVNVDLAGS